jgi:hypothetical protein
MEFGYLKNIYKESNFKFVICDLPRDHCNRAGAHHGRDRMVIGFITSYAINAYHH